MSGEIESGGEGENKETDVGENIEGGVGEKLELLGENVDVGFSGGVAMLAKVVDDVIPTAGAVLSGLPRGPTAVQGSASS